ncbi:MAG TPA: DUF6543 domain-containing protein [Pseudomonas sp.]|nr:DUF6543 domain-containing protein [Pseudomonas sp.]
MSQDHPENPHQQLIEAQLPDWSRHAQPEQWQAVRESLVPGKGLVDAPWFANAAPDLRATALASQARLERSQHSLARSLKGLQTIAAFAETLLAQRLQAEHQLSIPLRSSVLVEVHHRFTHGTYVTSHRQTTLLEAALHNFEAHASFGPDSALTLAGDAKFEQVRVTGRTTLGDSETWVDIALNSETIRLKPLPLAPVDFARHCRDLDIGGGYQHHLQQWFDRPCVRTGSLAVQRDRLRLAADLAVLRHDISGRARDRIDKLLAEEPVRCWQPSLFDIPLHEVLIIEAERDLLLYLPGDQHALLQFEGLAGVHEHLVKQLLQPTYRRAFLRYVSSLQQRQFLDLLQQNLDATGDTAFDLPWSMRAAADLHLSHALIESPLFTFLYRDHVARLQAEAADVAVPTSVVDAKARQRRVAEWQSLGMDALMLAGFFIPGVGTLMTAVIACQLLADVYEGYQAWSIGDRHLALQHLEAVGLNLALIGGLHAAGKVLPKLFNSPLMERLDQVQLDDGSRRLWRPALTGYASDVQLEQSQPANTLGQFAHDGAQYIRLEGQLYQVALDAADRRWRITRPGDPEAYRPYLEHNGEGAWRAEHEAPQTWSDAQCVRRLGLPLDGLDDAQLLQAMAISGVDRARLQAVHLAGMATPPLLADTLERLALAQRWPALSRLELAKLYERPPTLAEHALIDAYDGLGAPLAKRLLARLSAVELADWTAHGALPAWLRQECEQVSRDLPLLRALEGLYAPRLANLDSERLLLACVERLAPWPTRLYLEIRAASPNGMVLADLGNALADQRIVLSRSDLGYEHVLGDRPVAGTVHAEPYPALYNAVPPALQQAWGDVETLRLRTQQLAAAERARWPVRLWGPAARRPVPRLGLRGGAPLAPLPSPSPLLNDSVAARLRRLYPTLNDEQIERMQVQWRRSLVAPESELRFRETALQQLRNDLTRWATSNVRRQRASVRLLNAWRHSSTRWLATGERLPCLDLANLELENHDLAALALPDGLGHVLDLDLAGNRALSELPQQWLQRLPELQRLTLGGCRFDRLPQLSLPDNLQWLDMEHNRIGWDSQAQAALEQMSALRVLDLSHNPLLSAPDMTHMPGVGSLFLVNCSLTRLPQGIEHLQSPLIIDLSENQFQRLPAGFRLPTANANALSLESESLSLTLREQIEEYFQSHGADLLVADIEYQPLLIGASAERLQLWARVPLNYRRDLRQLIEDTGDFDDQGASAEAIWQGLERMDIDPQFRERALSLPATLLLDL